jgi:hypothetical protein
MPTFQLRRFSRPEVLKSIAPATLTAFLKPYRRFLFSRGVALPPPGLHFDVDYEALVRAFLSPDTNTPRELIDALYIIDEMAMAHGVDALVAEVARRGLSLAPGPDPTPEDLAVQVWLLDQDILERLHAEHHLARVRSFTSYQTARARRPAFRRPTERQLAALAAELDGWFEKHKRGRGARVILSEKEDAAWFLVRHGEHFKREESMEGVEASSVYYRPLKYDLLVYVPPIGELRINARSEGERQLYRAAFGSHLFGDANAFPGTEKYTLDPLRELGEAALASADIDGIDWVKLKEVQIYIPGDPWEVVSRKSDDVFKLFEARARRFPEGGRLTRGTCQVKFADYKHPRTVVIRPSNIAQFRRDDDSVLVEQWLAARGFVVDAGADRNGHTEPLLAGN